MIESDVKMEEETLAATGQCHMENDSAAAVSQEPEALPRVGVEGEENPKRDLQNLDADLLVEVLSYLPQNELFEVMAVSSRWQAVVQETSKLWRVVKVGRKWHSGMGRGVGIEDLYEIVHSVLCVAERVQFSIPFNKYQERILGGVLGVHLRTLELPHSCAYPDFFVVLLSHCPELRSLLIKGEPLGQDPIHICHAKLEIFEVRCRIDRPLTIDCLNLTRLSTAGNGDHLPAGVSGTKQAPFFRCPNLTSLFLAPLHCVSGMLESMAAHAPNIEWLESYCRVDAPFEVLYNFKALQGLKLRACGTIPLGAFNKWPRLERLTLHGHRFASNLRVRHTGLKYIEIEDGIGLTSPSISCFSLEELCLLFYEFGEECLEGLNTSCPKLKSLYIEGSVRKRQDPRAEVPINFRHENLEECRIINLSHRPICVVCPILLKLVVVRAEFECYDVSHKFMALCASLTVLQLSGALTNELCCSIILTLRNLRRLEISGLECFGENDSLELKHSNLKDLVIRKTHMATIVLEMEHIERVEIVNSCVGVLKVSSVERVTL